MKRLLFMLLSALVFVPAAFAKYDFQIEVCTIHSVSVSDDRIILIVSGDCRFSLEKSGWVNSTVNHGPVIIRNSHDSRTLPAGVTSWEGYQQLAKSFEGKKTDLACLSDQLVIERDRIVSVSCETAFFLK